MTDWLEDSREKIAAGSKASMPSDKPSDNLPDNLPDKMDVAAVKDFLLACHTAKHIVSLLPDLPKGLGPRDVRILDTIATLEREQGSSKGSVSPNPAKVRVSDVSKQMGVSRPGVTRDVSRLEGAGMLEKTPSPNDGRTVFVHLTPQGEQIRQTYATQYHEHLAQVLAQVGADRLEQAAQTIRVVHELVVQDRESVATEQDQFGGR